MKLIIDISDVTYALIAENRNAPNPMINNTVFTSLVMGVILNGTPLTESDDCVSRDELIEYLDEMIGAEKHIRLDNYETRIDILERVKIKAYNLLNVQPKFEDAFDKIKTEIGTAKEKWWSGIHNDYFVKVLDVIAIIDKYREGDKE